MMMDRAGVLATFALCWSFAGACGVLVHNEIFHRSTHIFALPTSNEDLSSHQSLISPLLTSPTYASTVQAGAFFPDWGYQCLNTNDDAEAAHWPPFLIAAVEHIISHYGFLNSSRPAEEQDHLESLISFIFAIASHQAADATWHAIRLPTGLLAALSGVDFNGDLPAAHRVLDFGGDLVIATRIARMGDTAKDWISDEWKVPVEDLVAIYSRLGRDVSRLVVRYCTMRGLAGLRSGLAVGPSLYDAFASQSPMLTGSLDDYYLGGVDEMVARTVTCWANLTKWFAYGVGKGEKLRDGWGICDVFRAIQARGGAGNSAANRQGGLHEPWWEGEVSKRAKKEMKRIKVRKDKFGAEIYSLPPMPPRKKPSASPKQIIPSKDAPKLQEPTYLATYTPYAHFGASLSVGDFSSLGAAVAVGAPWESSDSSKPGEGSIYILPLSDITPRSAKPPNDFFALQQPATSADQRFGTSSTPWKTLNSTFLAVSAPGPLSYNPSTPPSLPFRGSSPAGRIAIYRPGSTTRAFSISITGAELGSIGKRWWGEHIISADLGGTGDEYLIISGARSDGLRVCEGRGKAQFGQGEIAIVSLSSSSSSASSSMLEKGEGIHLDSRIIPIPASAKSDIPCGKTDTYEYFGASLTFSPHSRTLFVGAPGAGSVFGYKLSAVTGELLQTITIVQPRLPPLSSSAGPFLLRTNFGGGGLLSGVSPQGREWLAVGASDEDVGDIKQSGVLRIYLLPPHSSPKVEVAELIAEVTTAETEETNGRYGHFGKVLSADGIEGGVWVGSEHWSEERGGVWWVDVGSIVDGSDRRARSGLRQAVLNKGKEEGVEKFTVQPVIVGGEVNARFAASLATGPSGELIVGIPYSGVTRESQEERFYGAVAVFRRK